MDRVEVLRDIYAEWGRGNYRAGLELYDREMTLEVHSPIPEAGVYEGLTGLQRYMKGFLGTWEDYEIRADVFEEAGETVVVHIHHGGRASGVWVEADFVTAWTFDGDRVVRLDTAQDGATALAAARASGA
jgi:ketosteroid isomerase-like protein